MGRIPLLIDKRKIT